jgi:hypothetical protein
MIVQDIAEEEPEVGREELEDENKDESTEEDQDTDKEPEPTEEEIEQEQHKKTARRRIAELISEKNQLKASQAEKDKLIQAQKDLLTSLGREMPPDPIDIGKIKQDAVSEAAFNIKCNAIYDEGVADIDGFKEALDNLNLVSFPEHVLGVIVDAKHSAKVLKYLGDNIEVAEKLEGLTPYKLAKKIVDIENEVASTKKKSKLSPPIKPITAKSGGHKSMHEMSDSEYAVWRKKAN